MDTKFAKPSILGKPVVQPHKNQSVVRQPTTFKSERCKFSKPWLASQVDVINDLSKPDTPHYVPKVREYVFVKPHHVIASGSSRVQALNLNVNKMASIDNTSGPALQRKERCTLQCALSLEEVKSSCLRPFSSTSFMLFHACSVIKNGHMTPGYISLGLEQNSVSLTPYVPPSKKDYEVLFQQLFDEYLTPPPHAVSPVSAAVVAPRAVDPASSPSSTTIDQDVLSASTSPTTQEI
nr:hypothetical protein [Tanacetum cinerariifolium]